MKAKLMGLFVMISSAAFGQTEIKTDRIDVKQSITLNKVKITGIQKDTALTDSTKIPTSKAVKEFVEARVAGGGGGGGGTVTSTDSTFYLTASGAKINARWWYNVKDYGAIPNDGLSDDVAIQNAINACHANGGGTVYFPIGVYTLTNAPVRTTPVSPGDTALNNNQIYIPMVKYNADSAGHRSIKLLGESPSHTESQAVATYPNPMNGAVLNSTYITSVEDVGGYTKNVLGALSYGTNSFTGWNYTNVAVQDLAVIVATKNSSAVEVQNRMSGISFQYVATARLQGNVKIRTSSAPENQITPYVNTFGYITPETNNHANSANDKVYAAGFNVGIKASEHTSFQEIMLHANKYGLEILPYYKVIITSLIAENNAYIIRMYPNSNLSIVGWSGEKNSTAGKYYTPVVDIVESGSNARGTITVLHNTINNTGTPVMPTKLGDSIKVIVISDQYGQNYIPLNPKQTSTLNYNQTYYDSVTNLNMRWAGGLGWKSYGTGSAAGNNMEVQYNNSGVFGASSNFKFSSTNKSLLLGGATGGAWTGHRFAFDADDNGLIYGTAGDLHLASNALGLNSWTYRINGPAVNQYLYNGDLIVRITGGSGTAGNPVTWYNAFKVFNSGTVAFPLYGAGTARFDASGNISSNTETGTGSSVRAISPTITGTLATESITSSGSFSTGYASTAVNLTLTSSHYTVQITANGTTQTLPTALGITGRIYTLKLTAAGSSATIACTGGQSIDGAATYSLASQNKYVTVQSNGSDWIVIANN